MKLKYSDIEPVRSKVCQEDIVSIKYEEEENKIIETEIKPVVKVIPPPDPGILSFYV